MKITTLLENKTTCDALRCEHGLSLYIETEKHKILFDSGASDAFWENARALGIDLAQVDIAFLSHAHNDHCGGLLTFLRGNRTAKVYLQKEAFGDYYVVTPTKCAVCCLRRSPQQTTRLWKNTLRARNLPPRKSKQGLKRVFVRAIYVPYSREFSRRARLFRCS